MENFSIMDNIHIIVRFLHYLKSEMITLLGQELLLDVIQGLFYQGQQWLSQTMVHAQYCVGKLIFSIAIFEGI